MCEGQLAVSYIIWRLTLFYHINMLEGFIEKLLASKLGKFFAGIEKENLSVGFWSGEIVLENVYIKPFLLEQLQMPLVLKFGKVQRLVVRVPWARIQSNPVEVVLVGLYVVLTPQERSSWQYSQQGEIARRKEILVNHEIRRSQKKEMSVVSAEEEIRQKSFLDKITAKVIDNLQITIQDIHIRLEYPWAPNFSCGITLEKLEGFTTDFNWNRKFADRQRVCQEGYLIHKLITISSFALYWHSGDSMNLRDTKDENKIITHLREKIYVMDTSNYILQPSNLHHS